MLVSLAVSVQQFITALLFAGIMGAILGIGGFLWFMGWLERRDDA